MTRGLHRALWGLQGLLAFVFLGSGSQKLLVPAAKMLGDGARLFDGREWLWPFIGVCEILGAVGVILPSVTRVVPKLTGIAAAALALVMLLGFGAHLLIGDMSRAGAPVMLGSLAAFVAWGRLKGSPIAPRSSHAGME